MAADVLTLPAADILDDEIAAAPRKPPLLRRLFDVIVETQTRRARIEIRRVPGPRAPRFTTEIPPSH